MSGTGPGDGGRLLFPVIWGDWTGLTGEFEFAISVLPPMDYWYR